MIAIIIAIIIVIAIWWTQSIESFVAGHKYHNTCMTAGEGPYGFPASQGLYKYWQDRPKSWAVEYSDERIVGNMDKVVSNRAPIYAAPVPADERPSVASEYYHNPVDYCKLHPNNYPCPNYWLVKPGKVSVGSDNMSVDGLLTGRFGHVQDRDIDDNYHTRIINPEREDHGRCGNI